MKSRKIHGNTGRVAWNKGKTGIYSPEALRQMSESSKAVGKGRHWKGKPKTAEQRSKISKNHADVVGSKNPNWRGGTTVITRGIRRSNEYQKWRKAVLERDDYRCLDCGGKQTIMHVDHIYPFAQYSRLRMMIENGRALCPDCHKLTPTYAKRYDLQKT